MQKEERKWAFDLSKDKYQTKREVSLSTSSSTSSSGQIIAPLGYRGDLQVSSEAGSRTGAGKGNAPATPNMKELLKKVHLSPDSCADSAQEINAQFAESASPPESVGGGLCAWTQHLHDPVHDVDDRQRR